MPANFVHLRLHSAYSLAESTLRIKDLSALIFDDKQPADAITDTNNMFGALEFAQTLSQMGIQPIMGAQINLKDTQGLGEVVLLAKNETESIWKNLWLPFKSVSLKNYVQDFQLIGTQEIQHELTHRKLKINLNTYMTSDEIKIKTNLQYKWIKKDRIDEYGLPKPISKVISEL